MGVGGDPPPQKWNVALSQSREQRGVLTVFADIGHT